MPEKSRKVYATHTGKFSKVVDAPLRYVYDWCTDFRSDDGKFSKSRPRVRVIRVSPRQLVRIGVVSNGEKDPPMVVELVRLSPPNAWHKNQIGGPDIDDIDYKLVALSPNRTRISLVIVERWMVPKFPKKADWVRSSSAYWDRLVQAIEARYRSGLSAKG